MGNQTAGSQWVHRIEAWKRSGLTADEFGVRNGIKPKQLYWWSWWLRKHGTKPRTAAPVSAPPLRMLPVKVLEPTQSAAVRSHGMALRLGHGAVLSIEQGVDPDWAARLILRIVQESGPC